MERDAGGIVSPQFEDLVPPPDPARVGLMGFISVGVVLLAAALGLAGSEGIVSTLRLWLVGLGTVGVGYAVSLRPSLPRLWLLAGAAFLVAGFAGVPEHWDSARFMFRVLGFVAILGGGIAALTFPWRLRVASGLIVAHFFGIFLATTSPATQGSSPYWITEQLFNKVYMHYLQFVYLRNAYHFYSPEPGPASLLVFLIKTEVGTEEVNGVTRPKYERRWVVLPRRPDDIKDPLGVSYFRRLSITEQVAAPGNDLVTSESNEIRQRRMFATYEEPRGPGRIMEERIPFNPYENVAVQYRMPSLITYRYILPSYAQHVIYDTLPDPETMKKSTVMVYQLVHRTMNVQQARAGVAPYGPSTYLGYYMGEYDVFGNLVNPRDPMLYWHVPVYPKQPGAFNDPNPDKFEDYLSRHAGKTFDWSSLR